MSQARISEHDIPRELFVREDGAGPFAINDATAVEDESRSIGAVVRLMRADWSKAAELGGSPISRLYPSVFIAWTHRVAHWLYLVRLRPVALILMWWCHAITGAEIRPAAVIGPGLVIVHPTGIVINGGSITGSGLQLFGQNLLGANKAYGRHGSPRLGDDVVLSHGAKAIGPILVGDGATIGAMALALADVAPGARVKGIPAK